MQVLGVSCLIKSPCSCMLILRTGPCARVELRLRCWILLDYEEGHDLLDRLLVELDCISHVVPRIPYASDCLLGLLCILDYPAS
eukprot:scaffold107975_cov14-Tisochrysis_lutea.AAC.1